MRIYTDTVVKIFNKTYFIQTHIIGTAVYLMSLLGGGVWLRGTELEITRTKRGTHDQYQTK